MSKKYLSDIMSDFEKEFEWMQKMKSNVPGIIQAPTGYGKSTFFKQSFCDYCRKNEYIAIMLLPRTAPVSEFAAELKAANNNDVLTLATYQSITAKQDPLDYDFIICDECHFFVTDAAFNRDTDICFELIKQSRGVKIFISATPEPLEPILYECFPIIHKSSVSVSENDNIKAVNLLPINNEKQLHETVCNIMPVLPEKAIIFCSSAKDAHTIWARFRANALLVCSKESKYFEDVDQAAYNKMLTTHKFDCKYLVCTSAVDVGVSLCDLEIRDIICTFEPNNWTTIVQCIGRKRPKNEADKITLHLRNCDEKRIDKMVQATQKILEHYNYWRAHDQAAYFRKYRKYSDPSRIMYFDLTGDQIELKVDRFRLQFYIYQLDVLQQVQSCGSYRAFLHGALNLPNNTPIQYRKKSSYNREVLAQFADSKRIFTTSDKAEFVAAINYRDSKWKLYKDINILNAYMEQMGDELPFVIVKLGKNKERREQYMIKWR